jgi:putative hemolysin
MEILIILLLVVLNGIFAMSELAVVSARKARLQQWASDGNVKAQRALELADRPDHFLSTVQIGITLIGVLAGAFSEATIAEKLTARLSLIPWLAPYSQALGLGSVVLVITYLSLVIGELVPKRLALQNPERVACDVAAPMQTLSVISFPIVRLLSASSEAVLRLLGARSEPEPPVTEEEIKVLIEQGTQAGVFQENEQDMLDGVFRLGDRSVGDLMTPRTEIVWLDTQEAWDEIRDRITRSSYSRFPVCRGSLDNILGVVQVKEILAHCLIGQAIDLKALLQTPLFVPESAPASTVLELFKASGMHLALVIDEYGGIEGLITTNDLLEEIVGDIEMTEPQAVQREDGSWLLDGLLAIDDLKEILDIKGLPGEDKNQYQTLGGFVMMILGRIPAASDHFEWGGLHFEVVDVDGKRVDKVLVVPAERHE